MSALLFSVDYLVGTGRLIDLVAQCSVAECDAVFCITVMLIPLAAFFYCLGPLQSGPVSYQAVLFLRPSDSLRVL